MHTPLSVSSKSKANYILAQRHQIAAKRSNFWHSDLRNKCESDYDYVFHLTYVHLVKRCRQVTFW